MAATAIFNPTPVPAPTPTHITKQDASPVPTTSFIGQQSNVALLQRDSTTPFTAIRKLFDYLKSNPDEAVALNATYPRRGIYKTAAKSNTTSDQKFTIDLSPQRSKLIPTELATSLSANGLQDVLSFFKTVNETYVDPILAFLNAQAGTDLFVAHRSRQINFRLCDYSPDTAAPECDNGCGAHTDYGTFSIIFQDGISGLEIEDPAARSGWSLVSGDTAVILTGWCAVVLSGGRISAARHRVRRVPGVRRLSAVLFVAPDPDAKFMPLVEPSASVKPFSEAIMDGKVDVAWFKEFMGKKWRHREGNEELAAGERAVSQDEEIERLVWG